MEVLSRRMLSTGQVAKRIGCSPEYVMRLCDRGKLRCCRLPGSLHRRIMEADLVEFMRRHGYPKETTFRKDG
jgi:excisionase family DNA binding protein